MKTTSKYTKSDFVRLLLEGAESVSADAENTKEYLASASLDPDAIAEEGAKEIRKIKLRLKARKTETEQLSLAEVKQKARAYAEKVIAEKGFSFSDFVMQENLALQNRNFESFSKEDILNTLVEYFTLKVVQSQGTKRNG